MNELTDLLPLFQKIRSVCKECSLAEMPEKVSQFPFPLEPYFKALQIIKAQIIRSRSLDQDYVRLQSQLQSTQASLRIKIGSQQQIKLYVESLKTHIDELSLQKLQLLQNSKQTIRQLKRVNEDLFAQLYHSKTTKNLKNKEKARSIAQDRQNITDRSRAFSLKKSESARPVQEPQSIRQIIKTEYIDSNPMPASDKNKRAKPASSASFRHYDDSTHKALKLKQNSKTFQISQLKTDRQYLTSKKKPLPISFPLTKLTRKQQQQHLKSCYLSNKKPKNKTKPLNRPLWKQKIANRSVASLGSMEAAMSQKQTL